MYGPRFFVGYTFLASRKKNKNRNTQRHREMTGPTKLYISQNYHTTLGFIKQAEIIIFDEEMFSGKPGPIGPNLHKIKQIIALLKFRYGQANSPFC